MKSQFFFGLAKGNPFMKKFMVLFIMVLVAGCGPSPAAVEKALAETLTAQPTATFTTAPINTVLHTKTPLPTNTPQPTSTNAPTVTTAPTLAPTQPIVVAVPKTQAPVPPTSAPPAVQPTEADDLELDITIKVTNKCADTITLTLVGPLNLKFVVAPGTTQEMQAAKGSYTTTDSFGYTWTQELHEAVWEATYCD